ncbi:MAG: hypothetical protein ACLQE9_20325 [Roseiarcus sp.]
MRHRPAVRAGAGGRRSPAAAVDRHWRGSKSRAAEGRVKVVKSPWKGLGAGFGGGFASGLADPGEFRYHRPRHAQ